MFGKKCSRRFNIGLGKVSLKEKGKNPNVLVTGGAGYIGTHTIVVLLEAGFDVTVVDSLVNSNEESLRRVKQITKCDDDRIRFHKVDLCNKDDLEKVFQSSGRFDSCIHFAGLKAVGESVSKPLLYYENNLISTFNLLHLLEKYDCKTLIFSSSATVYGSAQVVRQFCHRSLHIMLLQYILVLFTY